MTHTISKRPPRGETIAVLAFLVLVDATCIGSLVYTLGSGSATVASTAVFGLWPVLTAPVIAWEARVIAPSHLEIGDGEARLYVGGRRTKVIPFGPSVRVDVSLKSDRLVFDFRAFSSCHDAPLSRTRGGGMTLCGIKLSDGVTDISCHHEDGWRLVDLVSLWDTLMEAVVDHDMEMGDDMWRYLEFREGIRPKTASATRDDLWERLRTYDF